MANVHIPGYMQDNTRFGITTRETVHGNPGERRILPQGLKVKLTSAVNLPNDAFYLQLSKFKWWAQPLDQYPWPADTAEWVKSVGVGLHADDVDLVDE